MASTESSQRHGVTLVELLIAVAVMAVALAALGPILFNTNLAFRVNSDRVNASEDRLLVASVLDYHIRLAGYVGVQNQVNSLCGNSIDVPADGSSITVRYFEDRAYGAASASNNVTCTTGNVATHVTFSASDGVFTQNGAGVVDGVTSLEVVEFQAGSGTTHSTFPLTTEQLRSVTGVMLRVDFEASGPLSITVPFVNRQNSYVGEVVDGGT